MIMLAFSGGSCRLLVVVVVMYECDDHDDHDDVYDDSFHICLKQQQQHIFNSKCETFKFPRIMDGLWMDVLWMYRMNRFHHHYLKIVKYDHDDDKILSI